MEYLDLIDSNFNRNEGSFVYKLSEGDFDKGAFNNFIKTVSDLNNSLNINNETRLNIACKLWSISLDISNSLACDYNEMDVFEIIGINSDEKLLLFDIIRIVPSFFQYNRPFELKDVFI